MLRKKPSAARSPDYAARSLSVTEEDNQEDDSV